MNNLTFNLTATIRPASKSDAYCLSARTGRGTQLKTDDPGRIYPASRVYAAYNEHACGPSYSAEVDALNPNRMFDAENAFVTIGLVYAATMIPRRANSTSIFGGQLAFPALCGKVCGSRRRND